MLNREASRPTIRGCLGEAKPPREREIAAMTILFRQIVDVSTRLQNIQMVWFEMATNDANISKLCVPRDPYV